GLEALGPELVEELEQGFARFAFRCPDHVAGVVVDDDGDVPVPLAVAELVDGDTLHSVETVRIEHVSYDPPDHGPHGTPGHPQHARNGRLVGHACEERTELLQSEREAAVVGGPRDLLDAYAASGAVDASGPVLEPDHDAAERDFSPSAGAARPVVAGCSLAAQPAAGLAPRRRDLDDELLVVVEADATDHGVA